MSAIKFRVKTTKLFVAVISSILICAYLLISTSKRPTKAVTNIHQIFPKFHTDYEETAIQNRECVKKMRQNVSKCLRKRLVNARSFWLEMNNVINECCADLLKKMQLVKIESNDDYKFIILPRRSAKNVQFSGKDMCNLMTIGRIN